jgi:hypothetical protein
MSRRLEQFRRPLAQRKQQGQCLVVDDVACADHLPEIREADLGELDVLVLVVEPAAGRDPVVQRIAREEESEPFGRDTRRRPDGRDMRQRGEPEPGFLQRLSARGVCEITRLDQARSATPRSGS